MWGTATLTIVMSSTAMKLASARTPIVTASIGP